MLLIFDNIQNSLYARGVALTGLNLLQNISELSLREDPSVVAEPGMELMTWWVVVSAERKRGDHETNHLPACCAPLVNV